MSDLKRPRLIIAKGFLFLLCGMLAAGLLLLIAFVLWERRRGARGIRRAPRPSRVTRPPWAKLGVAKPEARDR